MSRKKGNQNQGGNQGGNNQQQKQTGGILGTIRLEWRVLKRIINIFENLKTTKEYKELVEKNRIKNDKTIPDFEEEKQKAVQDLEKKKKPDNKEEREIILWLSILRNKSEFKDHIGFFGCVVDTDAFEEIIEKINVFYQLFIDYEKERFDLFIKNKKQEIIQKIKRAKSEEEKNNLKLSLVEIEKMTLDEYLMSPFLPAYNYVGGAGVTDTDGTSDNEETSNEQGAGGGENTEGDGGEDPDEDDDDDDDETKETNTN